MLRLSLLLILLFGSRMQAEPRGLKLGVLSNIPEATAAELSWNLNRYVAFQGIYGSPLPIHVDVGVSSKKLVSQGDFAITSPYLDIPFTVDFGPQWSLGALIFPWAGSFHLGLAAAHRVVTIHGHVSSPVYFQDKNTNVESNSLLDADVRSKTDQELLRAHIGQRFVWGYLYTGWYLGAVHPLSGRSRVQTEVNILNPHASEQDGSSADNMEEARLQQKAILHDKAVDFLHRLERQTLPLLGLEIGLAF